MRSSLVDLPAIGPIGLVLAFAVRSHRTDTAGPVAMPRNPQGSFRAWDMNQSHRQLDLTWNITNRKAETRVELLYLLVSQAGNRCA